MKNIVLEKINNDLSEMEKAIKTLYHNKLYIVVDGCGRIRKYSKTKRGATGYINKNKDWSYYCESTMQLVYPHTNDTIVEIFESDLVGFNSFKLWHDSLLKYLGRPHMVSSLDWHIKYITDPELLEYVNQAMKDIKDNKGLAYPKQLEEIEEVQEIINQIAADKEGSITETIEDNNINDIKVVLNNEKNGIEIYFTDKPSEDLRNNLKSNGFRWSKYNKCWYAKQSDDTINFANSLVNITSEEIKNNSEEYKKEKELEIKTNLENINIDDIEEYSIPDDISKRENANSMFRKNDIDHTKELRQLLQAANDVILEVLELTNDINIEYKLKTILQRFKKNYTSAKIDYLRVKASNPSWAVTGRAGRNARRDQKMNDIQNNKMFKCNELIDKFNNDVGKIKNQIVRMNKQQQENKIEEMTKDIEIPKFNRVKKEYNPEATNNIFELCNNMYSTTMNEYKGYYIFKNWGSYRVYTNDGIEVHNAKTKGSLLDAKKWLMYYLLIVNAA